MVSRAPLLVLAFLLLASPGLASPTSRQRETARRLMDEGKERARVGDKERSLEAYQKAHDIMKVPTTGLASAKAHLALGHLVEARDLALEVTRMPAETGEPAVFERARREARELEASLKPRIPTLRVLLKGGRAIHVMIDGAEIARLLFGEPVPLNPGDHEVVALNGEGAAQRAKVDLAERDAREIELLLPDPAAGPSHTEVLESPPVTSALETTPAPSPTVGPPVKQERSPLARGLVFGGFGLAAAGLVVGTVTGALTLSKASTIKTQCERNICDPGARVDLSTSLALARVSTVAFVAAGIGAAAGTVGFLLPKREGALPLTATRAAVWIGPGSVGVRGTF